jgi:hypothetical protein
MPSSDALMPPILEDLVREEMELAAADHAWFE